MEAITLCGKPGRCCPVLSKKGRKYSISDKGKEVLFTKDQLRVLGETISKVL